MRSPVSTDGTGGTEVAGSRRPSVGWIGLGAMGLPMVSVLLAAGYEVTVHDLRASAVEHARSYGAASATDATTVARECDVLCVMVATPSQLDEVLFGEVGAASTLRPSAVVQVMATVGPTAIEQATNRLSDRGVTLVDAPVSGGVSRAVRGELTFMISGPSTGIARVEPLVAVMARDVFHFGDRPGVAQRVKLVNQLLCGVHIAAAAEALAFAESLGLDAGQCWEAMRTGAAASFMLEDRGARMIRSTDEVRSALSIFVKDMALVCAEATSNGCLVPLADTARHLYDMGTARGLGECDDSALIGLWRAGEAPTP